jgi:preprotein translocase subunit SecA
MQNIGFSDTAPIQSGLLNNSLETAQKKVESYYFDTRKQLFEYDQALTTQRTGVYTERKRILQQRNLRNWVMEYAERSIYDLWICIQGSQTESFLTSLIGPTQKLLGLPFAITSNIEKSELTSYLPLLKQQIQITYNLKELEMECIEPGLLRELEKSFILQQIDFAWKEHLQKIVLLRDSIRWRAYGQKDPLTEYKKEAFNYFTIMLARIRHRVVYFVLSAKVILL